MKHISGVSKFRVVRRLSAREVAYTGMFAALVCAATLAFQIGISATNGYFNVGEIMVYASALLLGPTLGAIAGGVGSSLSDVLSGFATTYAPGTLVIKGVEAFLVGYVALHKPTTLTLRRYRGIAISSALLIGVFLFGLGSIFYSGPQESSLFTSGINLTFPGFSFNATGPTYFQGTLTYGAILWLLFGAAAAILLLFIALRLGPDKGWPAIAILIGGTEMVIGYFLYEFFVLQISTAIVEVPANIGQMVIGLVIGLPIARRVKSAIPRLNRSAL